MSPSRIIADSPLGTEALHLVHLQGREELGRAYRYDLELLSSQDDIQLSDLMGQMMTVHLELSNGTTRYIGGHVSQVTSRGSAGRYARYQVRLRPWLWMLRHNANCRIFHRENVPDVLKRVFRDHGFTDFEERLDRHSGYRTWDYLVQYRESDFNFVMRLMEQEGIYYYFRHEEKRHVLVLADSFAAHDAVPGYEEIPYYPPTSSDRREREHLDHWTFTQSFQPVVYSLQDYDFTKPTVDLEARSVAPDAPEPVAYEVFDYPGEYEALEQGEHYARVRMEEQRARHDQANGEGTARGLTAGALFRLVDFPREDQNAEYLVTSLTLQLDAPSLESGDAGAATYRCTFTSIPAQTQFRLERKTPRPLVAGPQTATVVGKAGEDVWTDEHGQVKVKFHWDREDRPGEERSCWVRVSQSWAGANWGAMFVPHAGQEVIVGFLEGDPDRPVIIGRVYNGKNHPPLDLPANAHKSIIRDHFGNELIMDGTAGDEHISLHSPSHYSVMQLGKSVKTFTRSAQGSYSWDSESFHLGYKKTFTKGWSFSMDRGAWASVKMGGGGSVTLGFDAKLFAGASLSFSAGTNVTVLANESFTWGFARELRATKGSYQRKVMSDLLLDSDKTVFITGGANDNTMLASSDDELTLTYDETSSSRSAKFKRAESVAKAKMAASAAACGIATGFAAWNYQSDVSATAPRLSADGKTQTIEAEYEEISGLMNSDYYMFAAAAAGLAGAPFGSSVPNPEHPSPTAKIMLRKDLLKLFAGKSEEAELTLSADNGILLAAKKALIIESEDSTVDIKAKGKINLKSSAELNVDAVVKHRNITILR